MSDALDEKQRLFQMAERNLIMRCLTGSRAYGTSTQSSDIDIRGVFVGEPFHVLSPFYQVDEARDPSGADTVYYELTKFVRLVVDQNPSILELLWVDDDALLQADPVWSLLRDNRHRLLSRRVRHTYSGYAYNQLESMKNRSKWISNPQPEERPRPCEFVSMVHNFTLPRQFNKQVPGPVGYTGVEVGNDMFLLYETGTDRGWHDAAGALRTKTREEAAHETEGMQPAAIVKFNRKDYEARKRDWENYWTWVRERNPERSALEAKQGFDGKNASHLLRLLRTGCEALKYERIDVRRQDAAELSAIRNGERSYEWVMEEAEKLRAQLPEAEESSSLPPDVDRAFANDLLTEMYERVWGFKPRYRPITRPLTQGSSSPDINGRVIVLDTEHTADSTDGRFMLCEIALVELRNGVRTGNVFHSYINPQTPVRHFAQQVHGLSDEFLADKPVFSDVAPAMLRFLGDSPMVAHDARGDLDVLNRDLALAGLPGIEQARVACTQKIASKLGLGKGLSLDALCETLGVDNSARDRGHGALIDATLTAETLLRMAGMEEYPKLTEVGPFRKVTAKPSWTIDVDGVTASIQLNDGRIIRTDLPDYPADTHRLVIQGKRIAVVPIDAVGNKPPVENPVGPAIIFIENGEAKSIWLENGEIRRDPPVQAPRP